MPLRYACAKGHLIFWQLNGRSCNTFCIRDHWVNFVFDPEEWQVSCSGKGFSAVHGFLSDGRKSLLINAKKGIKDWVDVTFCPKRAGRIKIETYHFVGLARIVRAFDILELPEMAPARSVDRRLTTWGGQKK